MSVVIEKFVSSNLEEATTLLETLGKIPAPSHKEDQRAAFCKEWFIANGATDVEIDSAKNVVCKFEVNPGEKWIVCSAHMDVVFEDLEPLPMRREGNILHCPGIGDDTLNLVNLMMSARYLIQHKDEQKHNIMIVANTCEEGLGNLDGIKQIFKDYAGQIKHYYSFDGYLGYVTNQPVGSHRYRITVNAQGGHSYMNFGNTNAIEIASRVITKLYTIKVPTEAYSTYNVGVIEGGSTVNSIAQTCSFLYEYRSESENCLQQLKKSMEDVLATFSEDIQVELLGVRPGMGDMDMDALNAFTNHSVEIMKRYWNGEIIIGSGSTDANIPLSLGVLGNTIGTAFGDKPHTRQEWVDLDYFPAGMATVLAFMIDQMG